MKIQLFDMKKRYSQVPKYTKTTQTNEELIYLHLIIHYQLHIQTLFHITHLLPLFHDKISIVLS